MKNTVTLSATGFMARLGRCVACWLIGAGWASQTLASPWPAALVPAAASPVSGIEHQVQQMAIDGLRQFAGRNIRRVDVQVGALDPRLRLAPCSQIQPYLPNGSTLWGRTRIGLRCVQGEKAWNVFLPITVKVMAPALVATGNLPAGHILNEADLTQAEVDLAENPSMAVHDMASAQGRMLSQAIGPGQSLRQNHLKARQWFAMGDVVTVVALGRGYRVVSQGEAMTPGLEGQSARVRMDSGRTLTGMPVADRQMELPL